MWNPIEGAFREELEALQARRLRQTVERVYHLVPFGLFAVSMDHVIRIHSSSGTTGKPTAVGYAASLLPYQGHYQALPRALCLWKNPGGHGFHKGAHSDDMLIVNGVNVFPSRVEHVLTKVKGATPNYVLCYSDREKRSAG